MGSNRRFGRARVLSVALLAVVSATGAAQGSSSTGKTVGRLKAPGVVVVDLRTTKRPLRNGSNVLYTTPDGARLVADVRGLQMWSYSASAPAGVRAEVRAIIGPSYEEQRRRLREEIDRAARNAEERRAAWARAEELLDAQRTGKGCWIVLSVSDGDGAGSISIGYGECPKGG
jgi:hypothetical protein